MPRPTLAPALALALLLACVGEPEPPEAPTPPTEPERAAHGEQPTPDDPAPEEQAAEEDEVCVRRVTDATPAELGDLLADLAFNHAARDACTAANALRTGDESRCDALTTDRLREGCRVRVAARHGRPDACPRPRGGERDPVCVAWASRIAALCQSAPGGSGGWEGTRCRAAFRGDAEACRELQTFRPVCERDVARIGPWLRQPSERQLPPVAATLTPSRITRPRRPVQRAEAHVAVERGARLVVQGPGCERALRFDTSRPPVRAETERHVYVQSLDVGIRARPGRHRVEAAEVRLALRMPDGRVLDSARPDVLLTGQVQVERAARSRAGAVHIRPDLTLIGDGLTVTLAGELRTYVRDVDLRVPGSEVVCDPSQAPETPASGE